MTIEFQIQFDVLQLFYSCCPFIGFGTLGFILASVLVVVHLGYFRSNRALSIQSVKFSILIKFTKGNISYIEASQSRLLVAGGAT